MKMIQTEIAVIKKELNNSVDIVVKNFVFNGTDIAVIFIKNLADGVIVREGIFKSLLNTEFIKGDILTILKEKVLAVSSCENVKTRKQALNVILKGDTLIVINGQKAYLSVKTENAPHRALEEPPTSAVINGPREGFVESLNINLSLIRKRIISKDLVVKEFNIGHYTQTRVDICYINSIAEQKIVEKVEQKIKDINIDGIIDSYYICEFLEEKSYSMFSQMGKTEKPDVVAAKLLEGRIAILVDGSPMVLTLPFLIFEDYQNGDDYYQKNYKVAFTRLFRVFGILAAVLLPGFYVASQLYHYKVLPLEFLVTIMNSTQGLPFTPFMEVLFVIFLFEILYESSLRMPRYLGMALSIVGALILGDTAVKAGLISSPAVMIVALSGITIYMVPQQAGQLTVLRLLFVFAGGIFGFLGMIAGSLFLVAYMVSFEVYGTPYLAPFSPRIKTDKKDSIFKQDLLKFKKRPKSIPNKNRTRQGEV